MHPDHIDLIRKLMNVGMALICGTFLIKIIVTVIGELERGF